MFRKVTVNKCFCDSAGCPQEAWKGDACISCGVHHCYDCKQKLGKPLRSRVYYTSGDDGYVCNQCLINGVKEGVKPLLDAYLAVQRLRDQFTKEDILRKKQTEYVEYKVEEWKEKM